MATVDLDVSSVLASTGWTGATVANLSTSNDTRATGGQKGEIIRCELDDVPGDFDSLNSVTLHVEGRRGGTGARTLNFLVELLNSAQTALESFTTANLGTSDVQYDSSSFNRSDTSATINGWQLRITVEEGGGMPSGDDTSEIDRMWVAIDYNAASSDTPVNMDSGSFALTGQNSSITRQLLIKPDLASFALTGLEATITKSIAVNMDLGALTLTGQDLVLTRQILLNMDAGSMTFSGLDANISTSGGGEAPRAAVNSHAGAVITG